jgi:tetratricopeptide (TPR) repeat protein
MLESSANKDLPKSPQEIIKICTANINELQSKKFSLGLEESYGNRGDAYIDIEEYDLALADLMKARELGVYNSGIMNNLGIIYTRTGQYEFAIQSLTEAAKLNPNDHWVYKC